jgi:hypothetical protein
MPARAQPARCSTEIQSHADLDLSCMMAALCCSTLQQHCPHTTQNPSYANPGSLHCTKSLTAFNACQCLSLPVIHSLRPYPCREVTLSLQRGHTTPAEISHSLMSLEVWTALHGLGSWSACLVCCTGIISHNITPPPTCL